ncbi:hypothetical protein TSUD_341180 [Trifolium subterraneum]|uniref:MATH domain-containing protein n=1 Tax=Trifolium subterraneum TaxID=3900 RepID=A0A2Z6M6N3_TRISU|nr:hypothetical protein TSUD_341180 [Trifolium subterraneum]
MEKQQEINVEIQPSEIFTWKIENFSKLNNVKKIYSDHFILGSYLWRIFLYPKGNEKKDAVNQLSIYLEAVETANESEGWSRDVKIKLVVFNQLNTNMTIKKGGKHGYNAKEICYGFPSFMNLTELHNPEKGFIVKDTCIVGAEVFVSKSSREKQVNQAVNLTVSPVSIKPTKQVDAELGYAALGRVIILLQTSKVKDMNEQACNELKVLWDELVKSNFDLTWLEPVVQSALGMKSYVEKALEAEKLKENMVHLELEMERLKVKSVAAEANLDIERNLLKSKGFKEIDLDYHLAYVSLI